LGLGTVNGLQPRLDARDFANFNRIGPDFGRTLEGLLKSAELRQLLFDGKTFQDKTGSRDRAQLACCNLLPL